MNKLIIKIGILFLFLMGTGCEKENNGINGKFTGTWINLSNNCDLLVFRDSVILRIDTISGEFDHSYLYSVTDDSLTIKYTGTYYIECTEQSFKFKHDEIQKRLTIYGFNTYFPHYNGETFIRSSE